MLPLTPLADAPAAVLGATTIRGIPMPVLDIGALLNGVHATPRRLVVIDVAGRQVALAVSEVIGVRAMAAAGNLPPLLRAAAGAALGAIRMLDGALVAVLDAARLLPETMHPMSDDQPTVPA